MGTMVTPNKSDLFEEDIINRASLSEAFFRKLASSINALNHGAWKRIGSVEMSYLPLAQFQGIWDTSWVLADGSDITDTDYGQFLLNEGLVVGSVLLPDMRGMAPIGINNGRSDGKQSTVNPALELGEFLPGGVKSHDHTMQLALGQFEGDTNTAWDIPQSSYAGDFITFQDKANKIRTKPNTLQSQNTVNSIGVNWFIKVWNVAPA